ncbi:alanine racemase [Jatrophihabitans sp. GAS493]|uniref:alanine racemase n=1 Tax=Jatrophihabitans sp. GAS493 TaxID=1907575 RepID=UPI000BB758A4|nr:alanine racemase [Jatrophihabitans sp. GAS493]SOD70396.1 alanine racemase [Jatrophihabitans sp. GAS493]
MSRTEAVVDLAAIRSNVETLRAGTSAELMAVVKADGYGHGLLPSARAALAGGASWLGVAIIDEALQLRAAGIEAPILAWLWTPSEAETVGAAIQAGVDINVNSLWALRVVISQARRVGLPARVHLKIDTGLSRNGAYVTDWPEVVRAAATAEADGYVEAVGIWSHFAYADEPGNPTIALQVDNFHQALDLAARDGVVPRVRHLANSAATLTLPETHFDLVRPGIAIYGLSPVPGELGDFGLTPAMTLRAELASVKRVSAGEGVSYGHAYITKSETTLALVPLGYADGVPRNATNLGPLQINGQRYQISGRVCMDQFVVDIGAGRAEAGDHAVLFGSGAGGEPTAQDWADALGTIHYEIVTRIGVRVPRTYVDADRPASESSTDLVEQVAHG